MDVAELSILISFAIFLFLFLEKVCPLVLKGVDAYILEVKNKIQDAEKSKLDSEAALKQANLASAEIKNQIEEYKTRSQERIVELEEKNRAYLEELRAKAELSLKMQLESELNKQKEILLDKLAVMITEKLSEKVQSQTNKMEFSSEDLKKLL